MCTVAVRQTGLPQVMESQSINPVSAVGTVTTRPTMSASHHAVAVLCSETPSTLRSPNAVATV